MAKGVKKSFKAEATGNKGGSDFPKIDYKALHDQIEEGTHGARVSALIDLGKHKEDMSLGTKGQTGFIDEEQAEQYIEEMKKKYGSKIEPFKSGDPEVLDADDVDVKKGTKTLELQDDGTWEVIKDEPSYIVNFNEFGGERSYQEVAIMADLTETIVDYGGDIGEKQFRVMLNGVWQRDVKGFQFKKSPPPDGSDVWTVKSNSKLAEIATATGCKEILEVDLDDADWSMIVGEGFNLSISKAGEDDQYLKIGKAVALKKKKDRETGKMVVEELDELECEPVLLMFNDVTLEEFKSAHVRYDVIQKIKKAENYEGSMMQEVIEAFEAEQKANGKSYDDEDGKSYDDEDGETVEDKKSTGNKSKSKSKQKQKDEDEDNEKPEDTNEESWDE